jgi:hypothetical protein
LFEKAWAIHVAACRPYDAPRLRGVAYPFGTPDGMPPHQCRVSWDVMQALTEAAPPPDPVPNPKSSAGIEKRLFGWPVVVDASAAAGTMVLPPTDTEGVR